MSEALIRTESQFLYSKEISLFTSTLAPIGLDLQTEDKHFRPHASRLQASGCTFPGALNAVPITVQNEWARLLPAWTLCIC